MKYKVGDKVRVRSDLETDRAYGNAVFVAQMELLKGKKVTISELKNGRYHIAEDGNNWNYTDEMLEPVEEMSAEEAIKLQAYICNTISCKNCPIYEASTEFIDDCTEFRLKYPEKIIETLMQWKADHEKKPIETAFVWMVRIIEQSGDIKRCVYEEPIENTNGCTVNLDEKQSDILKKYCSEHEGNFFAVREWICKVKEA